MHVGRVRGVHTLYKYDIFVQFYEDTLGATIIPFSLNQDSEGMSSELEKFPVGAKVQAVWSEDGEWYVI